MDKKFERFTHFIFVCHGKDCKKQGCKKLMDSFKKEVRATGMHKSTKIIKTKCTDRCKQAPVAIIGHTWLGNIKEQDIPELLTILKKD